RQEERGVDSDEDTEHKLNEHKPVSTQCEEETDTKLGSLDATEQVILRTITRSQIADNDSAFSANQELLCGWEPSEVRNRQLEDPNIAPIM
ncbi:hypothetical protein ACJMK2_027072, partial [Sinanodonta woodiana]